MKRFALQYTGGFVDILLLIFLCLTVFLIPVAVILLINRIEIEEVSMKRLR